MKFMKITAFMFILNNTSSTNSFVISQIKYVLDVDAQILDIFLAIIRYFDSKSKSEFKQLGHDCS